ncbi:CRISPR-associated helicase Cas3' [Desulfobotulus sp. H1]|uniref:CRISPR-associated helicase Cas3 n=1 Tax=Desulfobotulus pelophilus TaxID=2823377 RepID=A0ABT3NB19_9BACT|nr:CRISPR-associated helicase Cas3' [Desulfobotulus pelophilus]MCW7754653.1 CRISPR-associated helicase Cas3' [Desulfobotulus pelophilus]
MRQFYARTTENPTKEDWQTLSQHLLAVSDQTSGFTSKIGLSSAGCLVGLLHDMGKYSEKFQNYLEGLETKGGDHSTPGAQWIWEKIQNTTHIRYLCGQILALAISSHHSSLLDCLSEDGETDTFTKRMKKESTLDEILSVIPNDILTKASILLNEAIEEIKNHFGQIRKKNTCDSEVSAACAKCSRVCAAKNPITAFQFGLATRFLYSCLIDADRTDAASIGKDSGLVQEEVTPDWPVLIKHLENHLACFSDQSPIDKIRKQISDCCRERAQDEKGIFTLTVPTGGGKTLATLRFALQHAEKHKLERIIYVIPYTSIIDQNAQEARKILEADSIPGSIVLEHHSNLDPKEESEEEQKRFDRNRLLGENWDAPVIFTTTVQFLEALFGNRTSSARRMHRMAKSIIIFDEIQTLPIKCIHLFCNALNYLTNHCQTSAVLCTATQPLIGKVAPEYGALQLSQSNEIIPDILTLFHQLKRVEILNLYKPSGWSLDDVAAKVLETFKTKEHCLVIVNTKSWARKLFQVCSSMLEDTEPVFHLSTDMCPVHRMEILNQIRNRLPDPKQPDKNTKPILCISTQLIEAGVDISFGSVIRFVAGMDSILQAAGRCNRHMEKDIGHVLIINPDKEPIGMLPDIKIGKEISLRILDEYREKPQEFNNDLSNPLVIERYFQYSFHNRKSEMTYPIPGKIHALDETILNLLSCNPLNPGNMICPAMLRQSFATAAKAFKPIDAPTHGIIVPYNEEAKIIIGELYAAFHPKTQKGILRKAQKYTVNIFPYMVKKLENEKAIHPIPELGIYVLDERFYSPDYGLSEEIVALMEERII